MDHIGLQRVLPDHEIRSATMQDAPALAALIGRITTPLLGYADSSEAEVRDDLTGARFDIALDTVVAVRDGRIDVYAQGFDEHDELAWMDVYVDPTVVDFDAVADAAIAACLGRIGASVARRGASRTRVSAGIYQQETRMRAAYERAGLMAEAHYWRMAIDLDRDADFSFSLPTGVELHRVDPSDDGVVRTALHLRNESFRGHHGSVPLSFSDFSVAWRETERFDPMAWWFAYVDDAPVGLCLGDDARGENGAGFVRTLGVLDGARGRGIARALLLNAFDDYRRRGRGEVQLGVDSANATGATRLYESVGMRPVLTTVAMGCELSG